ncbi:MAG: hypothetical protein ACR2JM_11115, partial [Mycobacterium sp.]
TAPSAPSQPSSTSAPAGTEPGALFYSKAGSLYVSAPAGTPGRKLTDGPTDAQPAPSPDLSHVAFVRKTSASNYGGELWVLDLTEQLAAAGPPRRLVDPATLPAGSGESPAMAARPRWSPTGRQVAFVDNPTGGAVSGGILLIAAADTGALMPAVQRLWAAGEFAWAPDGGHIAWVNARSDVRPVDVNALTVGGESTPVVTGTNAFSVTYDKDGRKILLANGDASGMDPATSQFHLRTGGIYSVAASGSGADPTALFTKEGSYYNDVAALASGAVAFTAEGVSGADAGPSKEIRILDAGSSSPRTLVADVAAAAQGPAWGAGDFVAYLDTSTESTLLVTDLGNNSPQRIDTGVDSFAWPPRSG